MPKFHITAYATKDGGEIAVQTIVVAGEGATFYEAYEAAKDELEEKAMGPVEKADA